MQTQVIKVRAGAADHKELATLGRFIADGQLVAFPTETVYGIAARRDSAAALALLRKVKGRPADQPFTVHLADPEELELLVAPPGPIASAVTRRLWPGPLTLVLPDRDGGRTGFRLSDCEIARALFRMAGVGVVATSANLSGEPPLVTGREVVKHFKGRVAGILSAGRTRLAMPSTVAAIEGRKITVLRPGAISAERLHEAGCYVVLMVCTGNLCRSPMAEGMLRTALAERLGVAEWELRGLGILVRSAGTAGLRGYPATEEATLAVERFGVDLTHHMARPLTRELVERADVIHTAEAAHARWIRDAAPDAVGKIFPLGADGEDVPDPFGGSARDYDLVTARIENALEGMVERIISESGLADSVPDQG